MFVAITRPGSEYLYRTSTAHDVPTRSADRILDALNDARHLLQEGEIWHLYRERLQDQDYTGPVVKIFRIRSGSLCEGSMRTADL